MKTNQFMKTKSQLQQGDVLLKPIATLPKGATLVKPSKRGHVLAEGEVTGHHHRIEEIEDAELYREGERMLLAVEKETRLTHEEHGTITVPPGVYEIGIVREWDYLAEMERKVVD